MNTHPTTEAIRTDRAALEAALAEAGAVIRRDRSTCPHPGHKGGHANTGIFADADGVWRFMCHSRECWGKGADVFDLRAVLSGQPVGDLLREARGEDHKPPPQRTPCSDAPDMLVIARRCTEAITDSQRSALADQLGLSVDVLVRMRVGWHEELGAFTFPMRDDQLGVIGIRTRLPNGSKFAVKGSKNGLFIPADLPDGGTLYIAEGATDAPAIVDAGGNAIGRPSNTAGEDLILAYVRRHPRDLVVIVIDLDADPKTEAKTREAAERLAARLVPLVGSVKIIQPPAPHKDARAWRVAGGTLDDIEAVVDATPSLGSAGELHRMLAAEIDGTRNAISWPWPMVTKLTQALIPGTTTLVVGDPGSGKSLWMMEALAYWHDMGVQCAVYMLEGSRPEHLKRALAQRVGASWLTDLESVKNRPEEAMAFHSEHAGWLDRFGRRIYDAPAKPVKIDELIEWVEQRAAEGARVIVIDPITAAEYSERMWEDAQRFLQTVMPILDRHGASLVLVSHPKKGKQRGHASTLDDLAGGAAWPRFTQTVLWLERHDEVKEFTVREWEYPGTIAAEADRTLRILKARNGRGAGYQLAVEFDGNSLRFNELGAIVKHTSSS